MYMIIAWLCESEFNMLYFRYILPGKASVYDVRII